VTHQDFDQKHFTYLAISHEPECSWALADVIRFDITVKVYVYLNGEFILQF
jgi:hypothetical protein